MIYGTGQYGSIAARIAALAKPEVRAALAKVGADPAGGSPEAYGALLKAQVAHWAKVVKDSGATAN